MSGLRTVRDQIWKEASTSAAGRTLAPKATFAGNKMRTLLLASLIATIFSMRC